jgi:SAM-dependent methyltransferase
LAEPWYRLAFGAFYPVLYAHRDDDEARRCVLRLPQLAPLTDARALPVLDLGCGDGRHLQWFRAQGLTVIGLDLSRPLLAAAGVRLPEAMFCCGDMLRLPCRDGAFGAVVSLFTAFGYFGDGLGDEACAAKRLDGELRGDAAVATDIGRVLAGGGHWFLDYLDVDRVRAELADRPDSRERTAGPLVVAETRGLDPRGNAVVKDVRLTALADRQAEAAALGVGPGGLAYRERVALYTVAELDRLAAGGGLRRVAAAGDYDGAPLGAGPRWLLAYRKDDHA